MSINIVNYPFEGPFSQPMSLKIRQVSLLSSARIMVRSTLSMWMSRPP